MKLKEKTEKKLFYTLLITSTVITIGTAILSILIDRYNLFAFVSYGESDVIMFSLILLPVIINIVFVLIAAVFISKRIYSTLIIIILIIHSIVGTCFNLVFFSAD